MPSFAAMIGALGAWAWFILAVLMFALETVVPGVHFLWFGIAAVVVGALALAIGISWQWQLVLFAIVSLLTVFWVRRYARPDVARSDEPDLNVRGVQYVGRVVVVEDAIVGGRGKVRIGDTLWAAAGADTPAGAQVKITGAADTVLRVERANG